MNDLKFNEQKQIEPRFDEQPKPTKKMEAITMNELKLNKQHEPEFDELSRMLCDLRNFLSIESDFNDAGYRRNLKLSSTSRMMTEASSYSTHTGFQAMRGLTSALFQHTSQLQSS